MTGQAPVWPGAPGHPGSHRVLLVSLALAAALHALLLLGVGFDLPEPKTGPQRVAPLEVVVLRKAAPTDVEPEEADAYAQVNREGGGTESDRTVTDDRPVEQVVEPPPPLEAALPEPFLEPLPPPLAEPEPAPEQAPEEAAPVAVTTAEDPLALRLEPPPLPEPPPEPLPELLPPDEPPVTAAQILASRNLEIAKLTARIQEKSAAYAKRTRRKAISASTREYKYASYLEAWRRKVERVGNLNYPEAAKERRLYGNLILHVAVRADGSLEDVRVLRSSGFDVLDEAAVRIVELAAPFAPFPPDIRAETDVLDITRTWQFLSSNRLGWEN
jgi:protein TonB